MPTCRRKRVVLTEPSAALQKALRTNPDKDVFFLHQTGEIFDTYEQYAARMSFYRQKQFQCEVTGKSGLDYFQAVDSEMQEARTLHNRFPQPLKAAVLKSVQYQVVGRLDHLVEAVFERFKDRYFMGERILVDLGGTKYAARVEKVFPPKFASDTAARDAYKPSAAGAKSAEFADNDEAIPHAIEGDLKEDAKEANARDDPKQYYYWVHILEVDRDKEKSKAAAKEDNGKMIDSLREVQCEMMSRDRLSFSKSILRRFIRDTVDRDAAIASPWTVKTAVAKHYGVKIVAAKEEKRKAAEKKAATESDKRKKIWEEKELPPTKRQRKMMEVQEEKERQATEKAEQQRLAKEEAASISAALPDKKKKKPVRYPTEDLDVQLTEKDKKAGMKVKRPVPSRVALPFNDSAGTFESFLMTWNFLVVYGNALHLSTMTLDEFEHAIQHSVPNVPCPLLAEVHAALIHVLRTLSFTRHSATLSLMGLKSLDAEVDDSLYGIPLDSLTGYIGEFGVSWERTHLKFNDGREGWEDAVFGCLKDHATLANFPNLREILTKLLYAPDPQEPAASSSSESPETSPLPPPNLSVPSNPTERYYALPVADRIAILSFMTNLAIASKPIHAHIELCEEQLTALRKEKIEVNRLKKQYTEEMNALKAEMKGEDATPTPSANGNGAANGVDPDESVADSGELSDASGLDTPSVPKKGKKANGNASAPTSTSGSGKRQEARAKQASIKQATAEYRRLDEEVAKIERRLEGIEREFRKLLSSVRARPMGKDRFYNRIWWFDGMGAGSLVGNGGVAQYNAGRIFIQGPSHIDKELLDARTDEDIVARREEEEGIEGMLGESEWAVYSDLEELDEFMAWLNPKGQRELAVKGALTKCAKILGRIVLADPSIRCYTDIARKASGAWSSPLLSLMFCVELFSVSVLLVTLYADSLHSLLPIFSSNAYKIGGLGHVRLTCLFLPLSLLSYSSILGIVSTVLIIFVLLCDGFCKASAPGSLWDFAETRVGLGSWRDLGVAFGLFIAGFGCHPLIPSLARDMKEPEQFERVVDVAFAIATGVYALVASAGYLMFGNAVSGEISLDLLRTKGYSQILNHVALWMLVLSPLSKFALTTQPLTTTLEILLGIDPLRTAGRNTKPRDTLAKKVVRGVQKTEILAFVGCSSAFALCVIGPLLANMAISGRCRFWDAVVVFLSLGMAVWGTVAVFYSSE
ncbi:hypothetical protein MKEN_00778800 [Mycena kentingensis (nom. inval.)]|nr:hypothetical protein MKEN_00778800 [Mycena kentingensis (nom. inval.)]